MPRKARIDMCGAASAKTYAPGALHHIIVRGIERKAIFEDRHDRDNFIDRLGPLIAESSTGCYAWPVLKGLRGSGIRLKGDERILGSSDFGNKKTDAQLYRSCPRIEHQPNSGEPGSAHWPEFTGSSQDTKRVFRALKRVLHKKRRRNKL